MTSDSVVSVKDTIHELGGVGCVGHRVPKVHACASGLDWCSRLKVVVNEV